MQTDPQILCPILWFDMSLVGKTVHSLLFNTQTSFMFNIRINPVNQALLILSQMSWGETCKVHSKCVRTRQRRLEQSCDLCSLSSAQYLSQLRREETPDQSDISDLLTCNIPSSWLNINNKLVISDHQLQNTLSIWREGRMWVMSANYGKFCWVYVSQVWARVQTL